MIWACHHIGKATHGKATQNCVWDHHIIENMNDVKPPLTDIYWITYPHFPG